jgi:hypothetical protein
VKIVAFRSLQLEQDTAISGNGRAKGHMHA